MIFTLFTCSVALPIVPDKAYLHILRRFVLSCENKLVKNPPQMSKKKPNVEKTYLAVKRTTNRSNVPPGGPPQSNDVVLCTRTTGIPSVSQYHSCPRGISQYHSFSAAFPSTIPVCGVFLSTIKLYYLCELYICEKMRVLKK